VTHRFDTRIEARFEELVRACTDLCDVYIVAERRTAVPDHFQNRTYFYDFAVLRKRAKSTIGSRVVPGNCHLPMLGFFETFPDYERSWCIEYDVYYNGDWGIFFTSFDNDPADLLGTHMRLLGDDPEWFWRWTFDSGSDSACAEARCIAFLPVMRLSRNALNAVDRAVKQGWTGHFEMVVPTAITQAGLTISEIGGNSEFTPAERKQHHYLSGAPMWEAPPLSTIRWRPVFFGILPRLSNTLYHPDKPGPISAADIFLFLWLFTKTVVRRPCKALRYSCMIAARFSLQLCYSVKARRK